MAQPLKKTEQVGVSIRLPVDTVRLLDLWALHLSQRASRHLFRADVVVDLLERAKPDPSKHPQELVDAWKAAFDG